MSTASEPRPRNPLSATRVEDGWIHTAGAVGIDPASGDIPTDFEGQARVAIANLAAMLEAAGGSLATVQKTLLFLVRREDFQTMNRVYGECFPAPYPARSTVVAELVRPELLFEIEAVARVSRSAREPR